MSIDKLLHSRIGHKLDTELRAFLLEKRLHHAGEQRGQTLAQIIGRRGENRQFLAVRQDCSISAVQPLVVGGAQSKKFFFSSLSLPSSLSFSFAGGRTTGLRRSPTGMLYLSAKYDGSTS